MTSTGRGKGAQLVDQFAFVGNADEFLAGRRDDFFAGQRGAATLNEFQSVVALVGAIYIHRQRACAVQIYHLNAVAAQSFG